MPVEGRHSRLRIWNPIPMDTENMYYIVIHVCTSTWYKYISLSLHLESVEVGYSDIFLEYSKYLTTRSQAIVCLEYSEIYLRVRLEYVNPPGICLEYATYSFRVVASLCLEYSRYIPRIICKSPGRYWMYWDVLGCIMHVLDLFWIY